MILYDFSKIVFIILYNFQKIYYNFQKIFKVCFLMTLFYLYLFIQYFAGKL